MEIGFIGLGKMGFPMARRLIEAGHSLIVYDTQKAAMDRLVALGARPGASVKHIADEVETVVTLQSGQTFAKAAWAAEVHTFSTGYGRLTIRTLAAPFESAVTQSAVRLA